MYVKLLDVLWEEFVNAIGSHVGRERTVSMVTVFWLSAELKNMGNLF